MKKKKVLKVILIVVIAILLLQLIGLVPIGKYYNFGPFAYLHTWEKDVESIENRYAIGQPGGIIFYGASNFARWTNLDDDFPLYRVQNHAFGGSTDKDLVEYAERLLFAYSPDIVVFQTGSNDYIQISGTDEEKVAQCLAYKKEMYAAFHNKMPDSIFIVMSGLLLPGRSQYLDLTLQINQALEELAANTDYLYYVDCNSMTWDGSQFNSVLFVRDGIHLNQDGQLLWRDQYILPAIEKVLQDHPEIAETVVR